jgi:DNA-binding Lrp family transcriptional regulator
MVLRAYILIQAKQGQPVALARDLAGIGGVISVAAVNGPYDLIVLAEAADADDLGQEILSKIRARNGITRTLTCPVMRAPSARQDERMPCRLDRSQPSKTRPPDGGS